MIEPNLLDRPGIRTIIGGYILGACIAYGHAWWHVKPSGIDDPTRAMGRLILSLCAAAAWPVYIPVCAFEPKGEAKPEPAVEK